MGPTAMGDLARMVSVPSLLVTDTSITFWETTSILSVLGNY